MTTMRPRIFPRERLVCFRCGMGWNKASNLSLSRDNHSATRPSFYSLRPFRDTFLRGTCLNRPRQEGGVFAHTAHSVFAFIARRHGCERRIRTVSPAYEAGMLPLHHHRDISYVLISRVSRTRLHKFEKERNFHYVALR